MFIKCFVYVKEVVLGNTVNNKRICKHSKHFVIRSVYILSTSEPVAKASQDSPPSKLDEAPKRAPSTAVAAKPSGEQRAKSQSIIGNQIYSAYSINSLTPSNFYTFLYRFIFPILHNNLPSLLMTPIISYIIVRSGNYR